VKTINSLALAPRFITAPHSFLAQRNAELHYNRQQFIESAIREKIEKTRLITARSFSTGL
jgi:hypothetical protein